MFTGESRSLASWGGLAMVMPRLWPSVWGTWRRGLQEVARVGGGGQSGTSGRISVLTGDSRELAVSPSACQREATSKATQYCAFLVGGEQSSAELSCRGNGASSHVAMGNGTFSLH